MLKTLTLLLLISSLNAYAGVRGIFKADMTDKQYSTIHTTIDLIRAHSPLMIMGNIDDSNIELGQTFIIGNCTIPMSDIHTTNNELSSDSVELLNACEVK